MKVLELNTKALVEEFVDSALEVLNGPLVSCKDEPPNEEFGSNTKEEFAVEVSRGKLKEKGSKVEGGGIVEGREESTGRKGIALAVKENEELLKSTAGVADTVKTFSFRISNLNGSVGTND